MCNSIILIPDRCYLSTIDIPTTWSTAFAIFTATDSKFVQSTNKKPIVIHPYQVVTINGRVKDTSHYEKAVT